MKWWSVLGVASSLLGVACSGVTIGSSDDPVGTPEEETVDESVIAGANQNDRSKAVEGEELRTGAMVVSPSGRYIVMQRNTQTILYDAPKATYHELPSVLSRVVYAKKSDLVFAAVGTEVQAIDLATRAVRFRVTLAAAPTMLRLSDDDATLLVASSAGVHVVDASTGVLRGTNAIAGTITHAAFVPGQPRALVVGPTVWRDGGPHTPVYGVDLGGSAAITSVDVPNCESPIVVTPDASRAFLSPTYCSPGAQAVPGEVWTNPDPVSVIELASGSLSFNKNLPGFGPVAMSKDGKRIVAYLDVKRMDPAMFDDPKQVPWVDGPRYHLMTIEPSTLRYSLEPIGNAIPRFAMTPDGNGLLVDASAKAKATSRTKIAARAGISIGPDGIVADAEINVDIFGSGAAFGYFDLATQSFNAFSGPKAPLDRFVQFGNGRYVLTLENRADGQGGDPYLIDLGARATWQLSSNYGNGIRDVGLSADGAYALLRLRLPANIHDGGYYGREGLCVSADGTCGATFTATFEASFPFALVPPPPPQEPARDPRLDCPDVSEC
jgi:hypothetical protein